MSQTDKNQIDLDREDYFFEILEERVENNSSKIVPHMGNRETG